MINEIDVFEISRNFSHFAWNAVRWIYLRGSADNIVGKLYSAIRRGNDYNRETVSIRLLGRSIRSYFSKNDNPLIVAHPSLVGILRNHPNLIYQHGELIAPSESIVKGASTVFVPTDDVAQSFARGGYSSDQLCVSGLCIEPPLVRQAEDAFAIRKERLKGNAPLTGAFFSSGSEPKKHIDQLVTGAKSVVGEGGNAIVFAKRGGRLARTLDSVKKQLVYQQLTIDTTSLVSTIQPALFVVEYDNRYEENTMTAKLFPEFDYFVAPAHERSNWAVGLGLPMFIVGPCYGPFAPLNCDLLLQKGVAFLVQESHEVQSMGRWVDRMRNDERLLDMAQGGWGKVKIDGFARIAYFLLNNYPV